MVYDIMNDKQRKDYEEFSRDRFFLRDPEACPLSRQRLQPDARRRRRVPHIPSIIQTLEDLKAPPKIFRDMSMCRAASCW
jgi:hypothetical protein